MTIDGIDRQCAGEIGAALDSLLASHDEPLWAVDNTAIFTDAERLLIADLREALHTAERKPSCPMN